ncbi:hypothetical protein HGM15179_019602 [Zosterops borbonicus]|uniref:Reverse transcriptase n=1 Tax=Zosterops borbonicus TaxID=364589 RepID=A0A8K1DB38_9PASS|nr:hypothetical protein HGM15179_019602 [Zosterops borbonicus]
MDSARSRRKSVPLAINMPLCDKYDTLGLKGEDSMTNSQDQEKNNGTKLNGKKEDPGNYRPVSLTSVPGKIMEKIILGGTEKYLEDNAVIGQSQPGFMRGKSCLSNLISFYDKIILDKMSITQLDKHIMQWDTLEGIEALQRDLDKLEDRAITNHMKFNKGKCQILHLGWGNPVCTDRLGNEMLETSAVERDLRVLVNG